MLYLLKRHYCRTHMLAYINGELSPRARRRIARWMDADDVCYAEYRRQRDAVRQTQQDLPAIGMPAMPRLDLVWAAVDAEMGRPMRPETHMTARAGVVIALALLLLSMPFAMSNASALSDAATQPSPRTSASSFSTRTARINVIVINHQASEQALAQDDANQFALTPQPSNLRTSGAALDAALGASSATGSNDTQITIHVMEIDTAPLDASRAVPLDTSRAAPNDAIRAAPGEVYRAAYSVDRYSVSRTLSKSHQHNTITRPVATPNPPD